MEPKYKDTIDFNYENKTIVAKNLYDQPEDTQPILDPA